MVAMRAALASTAIGAVFCLAYGVTRGFGFGLPPYSCMYAVALGLVVGIGAYGALSIRSKWAARGVAIVAFALLSVAAGMTYANATRVRGPILSGGLPTAAPALKPTTAPAPTTPAVRQQP